MTQMENVEALTGDIFSDILRDNWVSSSNDSENKIVVIPKITDISVTKVDQGVLSDVYSVHLSYDLAEGIDRDHDIPPSDWLVKFCRPDLDLSWMCRNETLFYSRFAPHLLNGKSLPFDIPSFLNGSDKHIVLQEVTSITTYPLAEGCPHEKIPFLLQSLAAWHAASWESKVLLNQSPEESLVSPTGMGQRLPPLQKEGLFVSSWKDMIDHMRIRALDLELLDFATDLCQKLCKRKLRDIHDLVHRHHVTCVHGDFHIANWLFPVGDEARKPVLVDFATAGYGNPLVDLVFFMVVSTNDETVSDSILVLEKYYNLLVEFDPKIGSKISLSTLKEWFPWALVCQFLILVAYDGVCRGIAQAETDPNKRETQLLHFYRVNRRALLALKSIDNWDSIIAQLEPITAEEQEKTRIFCQNTPLKI